MPFVVSFTGFRPSPRYDSVPWTQVRIEEAAQPDDPFTAIDTQNLSPVDTDPTQPALRNITTNDATLASGWYRLVFLDAGGNEDPADPVFNPSGEGYPAAAELVAASDVDELTGLNADQQAALRTAAITAVETFCEQSFLQEGTTGSPVTRKLDGAGTEVIALPKRLSELTGLSIEGDAWDLAGVQLSEDRDSIEVTDQWLGSWTTRARRHGPDEGPQFYRGRANIWISGVWGWSDVPDAVVTALRYDMEDQALAEANKLAPTIRSSRALGINSVSQGGLSVNLGDEPALSMRARRQLTDYIWAPTVGAVV